ncbi:MAG: mycothiol conjugate amidase Mca [Acidimicrobiales bacterium]
MMSTEPFRLLTVHAHPDDESSKGAGTVARYSDDGARCVLVCCTGGEAGDILNPAMDTPEVRSNLPEVRRLELERAAEIIGYAEVVWLGYRDSGMPGTQENADPRNFANAPAEEAIERLATILRAERPHVVITYPDIQDGYTHPDHLQVFDITVPALRLAANAEALPDAGPPWDVPKLYYSLWSRARMLATHDKLLELGLESPFEDSWFTRPWQDHRISTTIDVEGYYDRRKAALLAHATQIDPASPFWFALPDEDARRIHPLEEYHLARTTVEVELPERDLFAGMSERAYAERD